MDDNQIRRIERRRSEACAKPVVAGFVSGLNLAHGTATAVDLLLEATLDLLERTFGDDDAREYLSGMAKLIAEDRAAEARAAVRTRREAVQL